MKSIFASVLASFAILILLQNCDSESKEYETISLKTLENRKIVVRYKFDPSDRLILELNNKERMCIQDARGLDSTPVILANKFIELPIVMRGGSEEAVRKCVIICVSNGKFYKSLDVVSLVKNTSAGLSEIALNINGITENNDSFSLILGQSAIPFDPEKKIFCDGYFTLNGTYYVNNDKDNTSRKVTFQNEKLPSLFNQYIFYNNRWFSIGNSTLFERTSTCE